MTTTHLRSIGLCAHYSPQGDWAFDLALDIARRGEMQLNIFHFLANPYDPEDRTGLGLPDGEYRRLVIEQEKKLRLYYDDRLGDYTKVGFRLCEDREWLELHRCLTRREFQLLVLPWLRHDSTFGGAPLADFADRFVCPVILVGPSAPSDLHLNSPARLISDQFDLGRGTIRIAGPLYSGTLPG
jgi:hypothetical protein